MASKVEYETGKDYIGCFSLKELESYAKLFYAFRTGEPVSKIIQTISEYPRFHQLQQEKIDRMFRYHIFHEKQQYSGEVGCTSCRSTFDLETIETWSSYVRLKKRLINALGETDAEKFLEMRNKLVPTHIITYPEEDLNDKERLEKIEEAIFRIRNNIEMMLADEEMEKSEKEKTKAHLNKCAYCFSYLELGLAGRSAFLEQ